MNVPRALLRHTITVEPFAGASGTGPTYGPAQTVRCHLAPSTVTVDRGGEGDRTRRHATTAYCLLDAADALTPQARVTVAGRVVEVVTVRRQEFPGGPTPDHLEIVFI